MIALLKQEKQYCRSMIEKIMTDELYIALPELVHAKRKARTLVAFQELLHLL